jgi:hypothetical protein
MQTRDICVTTPVERNPRGRILIFRRCRLSAAKCESKGFELQTVFFRFCREKI